MYTYKSILFRCVLNRAIVPSFISKVFKLQSFFLTELTNLALTKDENVIFFFFKKIAMGKWDTGFNVLQSYKIRLKQFKSRFSNEIMKNSA